MADVHVETTGHLCVDEKIMADVDVETIDQKHFACIPITLVFV